MPEPVLQFPLDWEFRVIAIDRDGLRDAIRETLLGLGIQAEPTYVRASSRGTYRTYAVTLTLTDRAALDAASGALSRIPGVRLVL